MTRHRARSLLGWLQVSCLLCVFLHGCGDKRPSPATSEHTDPEQTDTVDETKTQETKDAGSNADGSTMSTTDGSLGSAASSSVNATAPRECTKPAFQADDPAVPFERLSATVVDEEGNPIADVLAQACGTNVCLQQKTDTLGRVTISQNENIARLAFKYGDGLHHAQVVALLSQESRHELGERSTLRLPPGQASNRFTPGASLESSNVRLTLDKDVNVKLDRLSYPDEAEHVFVAREFEQDAWPASIAEQQFEAVWVFGPQKTEFCPFARLALPNTTTLTAGGRVDVYLLVSNIEGHFARYGEWGKVATATVSSDGLRIETDPDTGLPELGIVGLRSATESPQSD